MPLPFSRRALQTAPSFSRDFAGLKTLDHGVGPAITFTRASNATFFDANGTLQTAANDTPRFDHSGGSSLGLLIEEARTNLFERSAEFDDAYWSKIDATVSANAATSPSATLTADRVYPSTNSAASVVSRNVAASASAAYSASVFVKAAGKTHGYMQINFRQTTTPIRAFAFTLDLSSGTLGSQQDFVGATTGVTATATSVGSGWYRLSLSFTTAALTDSVAMLVGPCDVANDRTVTASGTDGIFAWGAQLEAGAFPTSYIPTTSAAATRSADSAVVTPISSFYNQAEGTLFAEYSGAQTGTSSRYVVTAAAPNINDGEVSLIVNQPNALPRGFVGANSATQFSQTVGSSPTISEVIKLIVGAKENDFIVARAGTLSAADTSGVMPNGLTRFLIGSLTGSLGFNGHIRKIAYWPRRLSNTLLQQLTT
jgi:hypothetical protein